MRCHCVSFASLVQDSCWAVGGTEPDPKKDTSLEFDRQQVVVPQGKPGPNPALKKHGGSSSYSQSEYLIYNEDAVRIRCKDLDSSFPGQPHRLLARADPGTASLNFERPELQSVKVLFVN